MCCRNERGGVRSVWGGEGDDADPGQEPGVRTQGIRGQELTCSLIGQLSCMLSSDWSTL